MDKNMLYRFFNGDLSAEEENLVYDWFDADPANKDIFLSESRFYDSVILNYQANTSSSRQKRLRVLKRVAAYAAVFALAVGLSGIWVSSTVRELNNSVNISEVPVGQRTNLTLSDGTDVCLNSRSRMEYPAYFGRKREVVLNGEAYFNVAHNPKKPFRISAYQYDVEVLGTEFNIESYPDQQEFSLSLFEGSVKLISNTGTGEIIMLSPNQQASLVSGKLEVSPISNYDEYRWREGLISFRDKTIEELIRSLERYFDVTLDIQSEELPQNLVSGKIRVSSGIDHALKVLQKNAPFEYYWDESENIIFIK